MCGICTEKAQAEKKGCTVMLLNLDDAVAICTIQTEMRLTMVNLPLKK